MTHMQVYEGLECEYPLFFLYEYITGEFILCFVSVCRLQIVFILLFTHNKYYCFFFVCRLKIVFILLFTHIIVSFLLLFTDSVYLTYFCLFFVVVYR